MRTRPLGQSGIDASIVGFGAWAVGGWTWGGADEAASIHTIHAAIDAGVNLIDTAPIYGFGLSEQVVGKAIRDRRDRVVLATKCGLVCNTTEGQHMFSSTAAGASGDGHIDVYRRLRPDSIRHEVERSLTRLGTDVIDLYQTHWQDPHTPIEDTMSTLMDLKREGKIRAIGVSNATADQIRAYEAVGPIDADQEEFSMLDRRIEADQAPYCTAHNIAILAYSPIGLGLLTGKVGPDRQFPPGDMRRNDPNFSVENRTRINAMLDRVRPVAEKHTITLAQLAIAWALHQLGVTHALVGARTPEQSIENAAAGDIALDADDLRSIAAAIASTEPAST